MIASSNQLHVITNDGTWNFNENITVSNQLSDVARLDVINHYPASPDCQISKESGQQIN